MSFLGMQKISLVLPHGQSDIIDIQAFITRYLAHQIVQEDQTRIETIHPTGEPPGGWCVEDRVLSASFERREHQLKQIADLNRFCAERFKTFLSKKPIEFSVGVLTIDNLQELAIKYMDNFGSDRSVVILAQLNKYTKLAVIIDMEEAFKIYRTENARRGELVELNPKKWVVGKYTSEVEMFKKFHDHQRVTY